jgi:hypothetical protein
MDTAQAPPRPVHRRFPGGPPLAGLAATSTALFLAGLIASTAMAGTTFSSPSDPAAGILAYFHDHPDAVTVSGFFQFAASVPLAIYAATASSGCEPWGSAPGASPDPGRYANPARKPGTDIGRTRRDRKSAGRIGGTRDLARPVRTHQPAGGSGHRWIRHPCDSRASTVSIRS